MAAIDTTLVHIGSAKAASTWLQSYVLRNSGLGFAELAPRRVQKSLLTIPSATEFDSKAAARMFAPLADQCQAKGLCPVISIERLSGSSRKGHEDAPEFAKRVKAVFPAGRIFFVVREQRSMLRAQYFQYIRRGGTRSIHWFLEQSCVRAPGAEYFRWDRFKYAELWTQYQTLFGKSNTLLLPVELLQSDPGRFLKELCAFSGVRAPSADQIPNASSVRVSQSNLAYAVQRRLNALPVMKVRKKRRFANVGIQIDALAPEQWKRRAQERIDAIIKDRVQDFYAESNKRLAAMSGVDLAKFGFDLGR